MKRNLEDHDFSRLILLYCKPPMQRQGSIDLPLMDPVYLAPSGHATKIVQSAWIFFYLS